MNAAVSEADWHRLAKSVAGRVLRPTTPGFQAASLPFNKRFRPTPSGVVSVAGVADVQRAVQWAREVGTDIVARGGGHSYAGYSAGTGLVLDLRALNLVSANGSTGLVTTGGGAVMSEVYAAVRPHEMAFPLGNGDTVGIAGLTLGGGSSAISRSFGLTADSLVRATLVTADGRLIDCDAEREPDLFWACRGGGGGSFGVVVSLTFQARPVSDLSTYLLLWKRVDAPKVIAVLQEIEHTAPEEFSLRIGVSTTGPDTVVSAVGVHLGPASELREILDPVLAVTRPFREEIADRTFWQGMAYLRHETSAGAFAARTNFGTEPLPEEAIMAAMSWVDRWPGSGNTDGGGFAMFGWGGEISRVAPADTAFAHRDARYLLAMDTSWSADDEPAVVAANLRWLNGLREALAPYVSAGAYQNFTDPDLLDWRAAYYGANYPRLVEVKRRYDPDNVFRHPQSVGS